tara:strand:+ start:172 stop:666 length:495 start_codon:yes stop_codon:yes gene_type:complete
MAFNSNTVAGTVVHSTNEFNTRLIVPNDVSLVSSTDYQSLLKLSLGKYERAIFRIWLDLALQAEGDFKYKITTPSNTVSYRARRVSSEAPISGAVTEAAAWDAATSGTAETTIVAADGDSYVKLDGTITLGGTAGDVNIQVAQNTSNATASIVKFGSYFEYMKF